MNYNRLQAGDFKDEDVGCVIGQGNIIRRTADGGTTWSVVHPTSGTPDMADFGSDLHMSSNGYGVAIGTDSFFAYSSNSGASWTVVSSGSLPSGWQSSMNACEIAPSSTIAFIGGPGGTVFKVDLAGSPLSWTAVSISTMSDHVLGMAFVSTSVGYVVGTERAAYVTSNGGSSWTSVPVSGSAPGVDFRAVAAWGTGSSDAVAVGTRGNVYKLTSGTFGKMTIPSGSGTLANLNDVVALDSGAEFMIAGDGGTILRYASSTWSSLKSTSGENLYSLAFDADDHGFAIGLEFAILEYR